jgi:DNA polymerase-3 subunit alpha
MRNDFVSLHTHSTYSYGDGFGQPAEFVNRAIELGQTALALTEHGNVSSHVKLEKAAQAARDEGFEFKPIYGCELYTRNEPSKHKYHLGVLAMNAGGYQNLLRLVSRSWENFYYHPTTTSDNLFTHNDGLIVLSGCLGSAIACKSIGGKDVAVGGGIKTALTIAESMRDKFGDRYYLEVQAFPELPKTQQFNQMIANVSETLGIPLVVTLDAHYPRLDNQEMHPLIHAIARGGAAGKKTVDQQEAEWDYDVPMTLLDRQEIGRRLKVTGLNHEQCVAALDTTLEIAERCNVILPKTERMRFPLPTGVNSAVDLMWEWLRDGWRHRDMTMHLAPNTTSDDYVARLKREMDVIIEKDYVDSILMLADVVRWAKNNGILVGPARGSAAASLVVYLLRITEIDPMLYPQMYFERFIDPNRMDLPDIDLDFDDERRDEIRQYLMGKYGRDHVGNIGTYTAWKGRNAIDDVARVHSLPRLDIERFKEFIIDRTNADSRATKTLMDTVEQFPLAKAIWDKHPELEKALPLEGNLKGFGVHSAGLVVSEAPLTDTVALYTRELKSRVAGGPKRKLSVLSVDKRDAEYLGMMKIDFLGLTTLGMLKNCMELVGGMTLDELYRLPTNDERIIDAFRRCDVRGIFQYEGRTTRNVVTQLKPDNFLELIDINALSRPGPYHSGTTLDYISIKWGNWDRDEPRNAWTYNPIMARICEQTKYQIIFQEQLLSICREIGQFDWIVTAQIRRIVSWKYGEAAFNAYRQRFVEGAATVDINEKMAEIIFKRMMTAGQYTFNFAHAVAYSLLGYWSMYFKTYHPREFYAAQLRKLPKDKWQAIMRDAQDQKFCVKRGNGKPVSILGADLELSQMTWAVNSDGILPGFAQMPGIGESLALLMVADRDVAWERGENWGIDDVGGLPGIGPKKLEVVKTWTNRKSVDPFGISALRDKLNETRQLLRNGQLIDSYGVMLPATSHKSEDLPLDIGVQFYDENGNVIWSYDSIPVVWVGRIHARNLQDIFEEHRSRYGTDLDPNSIKRPDLSGSVVMHGYDDTDEINVRVNRWKFPHLKDLVMRIRLDHDLLVVDGYRNKTFGRKIEVNRMWVIDPE